MPEDEVSACAAAADSDLAAVPGEDVAAEGNNYKYRKLLYLFKFSKHHKKFLKKKSVKHNSLPLVGSPEERRNQLDQDIKNSWDTLPETLRRRKQRVSRALLSEFIDADNPDAGDVDKPGSHGDSEQRGDEDGDSESRGGSKDKELDLLHRSGVYYDDEDEDDDEDDARSSASSSSSEKNEVCVYQLHKTAAAEKGGVEILTRAIFHKQDENDNDVTGTGSARGTEVKVSLPAALAKTTDSTALGGTNDGDENGDKLPSSEDGMKPVGEEEVYQKLHFDSLSKSGSLQRLKPMIPPEDTLDEIPLESNAEKEAMCAYSGEVAESANSPTDSASSCLLAPASATPQAPPVSSAAATPLISPPVPPSPTKPQTPQSSPAPPVFTAPPPPPVSSSPPSSPTAPAPPACPTSSGPLLPPKSPGALTPPFSSDNSPPPPPPKPLTPLMPPAPQMQNGAPKPPVSTLGRKTSEVHSDADSGVEARGGSLCDTSENTNSSLGENNCPSDDGDYATIGDSTGTLGSRRSAGPESDSTLAADDVCVENTSSLSGIYSRLQPKSQKVPSHLPPSQTPKLKPLKDNSLPRGSGKKIESTTRSGPKDCIPLGLDSEALEAVEMLARAVSSDSLLLDTNSSASVSSGSPANSHASLNMKRDEGDDSGTDVNNPSSSSSSTSSCAGDTHQSADCGDYEDVSPIAAEHAAHKSIPKSNPIPVPDKNVVPPPPSSHMSHVYEAAPSEKRMSPPKTAPLYSAIGKPKLPAPGAQPLPGMYSDMSFAKDKEGAKPQFLLEALSKRAAAAEASKAKHEEETYTAMDCATPGSGDKPQSKLPSKTAASSGTFSKKSSSLKPGQAPATSSASASLTSNSAGCNAALSQLSAQKFPALITAPMFYNPLVQEPPATHAGLMMDMANCMIQPNRDDPFRPGNKLACPIFKPHGFEPVNNAPSDSEHLTDSFDEDEVPLPSGKPGLMEEPVWSRGGVSMDPASHCSWRASLDPLLCRRSSTMETIVEEPPSGEDSRLTVREILRRFEELGGKVPSLVESVCDDDQGAAGDSVPEDDEEKSATLREIQETLLNLEEKVRNYQCKRAGQQQQQVPPQSQQQQQSAPQKRHHHHHSGRQRSGGGRLETFQSNDNRKVVDGWTGRVQSTPQQQAQPQQASHQAHQGHSSPAHQPHAAHQNAHLQHASLASAGSGSGGVGMANGHHAGSPVPGSGPASLPVPLAEHGGQGQVHDGKHSLLQFAIHHFRQSPEKFEMLKTADGSISGSLDVIESLKTKKTKGKSKGNKENEWTWKEQVDLVKFSPRPIEQSLLRLETEEISELAVECFVCVMRYMGDLPMTTDITEVKCVYTVLMHCHKHEALRDEVYCQLMKQTTNNKSQQPESCQRGWRLFSIVAAYFTCTDTLKPYLFKYLETAAYDKRRAYHGTAMVCLQNLRKTFKYGGRKNVPSVEEITAISAGRNSKRQMYRLPGGTERVVNTRSTTVVQDVIEEICGVINVTSPQEMEEFSLYCIVEGDTFTMPLAREEYILDVTTELHKNQQVFYLIFCRSVWHFPLRLDSHLYIEVVFNQIAPDYLEGLLLVMPGETLQQDTIYEIAKMAALLHRAADMTHVPAMKETKFLLPKPALTVRDIKPAQWVNMVQSSWVDVQGLETIQAKAQVLEMLSRWPLFGSSFFAVKRVSDPKERADHILALNRHGVHFIDIVTHETLLHHPFSEVISTRKVKSEDGTLFLDMKCGNLMQQRITRLQTDQAHEISRLIRQYITLQQRVRS